MVQRIIDAARVLTGTGRACSPGSVVVDGPSIAWVGDTGDLPANFSDPTIERLVLPDATVLPALIDAHVQLTPRRAALAANPTAGAALVRGGVATVRDFGAPGTARLGPGPRVLSSGTLLTGDRGHGRTHGEIATLDDVEYLIGENHRRGATWISVQVTGSLTDGGECSPYELHFTDDRLTAIVHAAHDRELPVAAHAHGSVGIRQAVEAGVDSIEHCTWLTSGGFELDPGLVRALATRGIPVCPTVNHHSRHTGNRLPWRQRQAHLRRMAEAGVPLLPGTNADGHRIAHGRFADALAAWTELGLTPARILESATRQAAQALGVGHLTGTLEVGKSADLIAVRGNPTQCLDVLAAPLLVVTNGHLHDLAALAEQSEDARLPVADVRQVSLL